MVFEHFEYTQIDVLRHGECQGGEIFRGSTDVELTELGHQQMQCSVEGLSWDHIVCSPLKRCRLFAEGLSETLGIPITIDQRWREFNFGVWEGRLRSEVWNENREQVAQFFGDPESFTPEKGDSYNSVKERVSHAWQEILETHKGKRVLVVTHGGIFRALHTQIKSLPSDAFNSLEVPYACLTRWKHYDSEHRSRSVLSFHNRPHELTEA